MNKVVRESVISSNALAWQAQDVEWTSKATTWNLQRVHHTQRYINN